MYTSVAMQVYLHRDIKSIQAHPENNYPGKRWWLQLLANFFCTILLLFSRMYMFSSEWTIGPYLSRLELLLSHLFNAYLLC